MSMNKAVIFSVLLMVIIGLVFTPSYAEQSKKNQSISKERPQYEEIKQKIQNKLAAKEMTKKAQKVINESLEKNKEIVRSGQGKTSLDVIKQKVSAMPDMAKEQRKQLEKIRSEIDKRTELKKLTIEKLIKSSGVGKPLKDSKTIEYGRNK